jgi:cytoskeletal protein CcmA (bactofilin family)
MFKKRGSQGMDAVISSGTVIAGDITTCSGIRIDGKVNGKIVSEGSVTIGKEGTCLQVTTEVDLIVSGKIVGDVSVKGSVKISNGGKIIGDITCRELTIEPGGFIDGRCNMTIALESQEQQLEAVGV